MSGILIPDPIMQWFDDEGLPLAFGSVKTYVAGTSTFLPAYSNYALTVPYGPSIPLDAEGKAVIYLGHFVYKIDVQDQFGVSIDGYPRDNVPGRTATLQDLSGIINIKDFGAIGDGVTDDTVAIQNAIDAAYAVINGSGRVTTVWAPSGEYLSSTLHFKNQPTVGFGGGIFAGAGLESTKFTLKAGTNGPLFDLGGPTGAESLATAGFRDFFLEGNKAGQTVAAPLLRLRRVDRCNFERILVRNSKGDNILINNSSVYLDGVQVFSADGNGITIEDCDSTIIERGFINNNLGYGLKASYIASVGILSAQGQTSCTVRANHFEQNQTGEMLITSFDNAEITNNDVNAYAPPAGAIVSPIISIQGSSAWNRIQDNFFDNINMIAAYDDGTGLTDPAKCLAFGALTHDNIWGNNSSHEASCKIGGVSVFVPSSLRVEDLGRNYSFDPIRTKLQAFVQDEGGHTHAGWQAFARTNLLLDSEDLTTANWTVSNITGRANSGAMSNPYVAGGTATEINPTATSLTYVQQAVAGLAVVSGDLYTFSIWVRVPTGTTVARDIRMEIYDSTNVLLARRVWQFTDPWQRISVTLQATAAYAELRCRMTVANFAPTGAYRAWGAMLNLGDLAPYVPTTAAAVTTRTGAVAMRVTATKALCLYPTQATVGAAGGASALPATPLGYFLMELASGTEVAVPYYPKA